VVQYQRKHHVILAQKSAQQPGTGRESRKLKNRRESFPAQTRVNASSSCPTGHHVRSANVSGPHLLFRIARLPVSKPAFKDGRQTLGQASIGATGDAGIIDLRIRTSWKFDSNRAIVNACGSVSLLDDRIHTLHRLGDQFAKQFRVVRKDGDWCSQTAASP